MSEKDIANLKQFYLQKVAANNLRSIKSHFGTVGDRTRFLPVILLMILPLGGSAQSFWMKPYLGGGFGPPHALIANYWSDDVFVVYKSKPQLFWMLALERQTKKGTLFEFGVNVRAKQKQRNFLNLQLAPNSNVESVDVGATNSFGLDMNLEYSLLIVNNIVDKLDAYFAFIVNTGYASFEFNPNRSSIFPRSDEAFWGNVGVAPRAQLAFGNRWKMDINLALFLLNFNLESSTVRNPALNASQQSSNTLVVGFGNKLWLRMGVGYRI